MTTRNKGKVPNLASPVPVPTGTVQAALPDFSQSIPAAPGTGRGGKERTKENPEPGTPYARFLQVLHALGGKNVPLSFLGLLLRRYGYCTSTYRGENCSGGIRSSTPAVYLVQDERDYVAQSLTPEGAAFVATLDTAAPIPAHVREDLLRTAGALLSAIFAPLPSAPVPTAPPTGK